jgi:hypothetical protein
MKMPLNHEKLHFFRKYNGTVKMVGAGAGAYFFDNVEPNNNGCKRKNHLKFCGLGFYGTVLAKSA